MQDIQRVEAESVNLKDERISALKELMPEAFFEGGVDFEKLRLLLGDAVEDANERYAFTWPGKRASILQSQTPSTATLRPCLEKSRGRAGEDGSFDSDNIYIEGDNLEVLKLLQRAYHGQVKMIYIDPPYNTGKDFVYHDNFGDTIANYKQQAGLGAQSNPETSGRYHSDWCSMMYPRLKLARELLNNRGVICISIDDNEIANLKNICNEIFGEQNFVAQIPRQSRSSVQNDTDISISHEYLLLYAKKRRQANRRLKESNAAQWHSDDSFACYPKKLDPSRYSNPDNDPRGPWKADPFDAPHVRPNLTYPIMNPGTGEQHLPPSGRCWRTAPDKYEELLNDSRIVFGANGTGRPQLKVFYEEKKEFGEVDNSWWSADRVSANTNASRTLMEMFDGDLPFDTPKPIDLIENLIRLSLPDDEDGYVLDFFSGSATTAHAVLNINRSENRNLKYMLIQLPEHLDGDFSSICEIGEERIRRAGDKIKAEVEAENAQLTLDGTQKTLPDIGFRVFRLDESGIEAPKDGVLLEQVVKPGRSDVDIIFECALKMGLDLTVSVSEQTLAGYDVYVLGDNELVCCMNKGLNDDVLEEIAKLQPKRVLMLDSILTDTLKLNAIQIFKHQEQLSNIEIGLRTV